MPFGMRAPPLVAMTALAALALACTERSKPAPTVVDSAEPAAPADSPSPTPIVDPSTSRLTPPVISTNGPCPGDMVQVFGFCIDRYEAPNVAGEYPLVMESSAGAEKWCADHGKRLCGEDEWERACSGRESFAYPYGVIHEEAACADEKTWIEKDEPTITQWPEKPAMGEVTRLYQAERSGTRAACVSGFGAYDMTGNVEEWVVGDKKRHHTYEHVLKGCYWSGCYGGSKPTCTSTNAAHADAFKFYETGFRCCRDAKPGS